MSTDLDFELPVSICEVDESLAGWPFRKPADEPEPSLAMRLISREVCQETRRRDIAEMTRAYNLGADDGC